MEVKIDVYENKQVKGYGKCYPWSLTLGKITLVSSTSKTYKNEFFANRAANRFIDNLEALFK